MASISPKKLLTTLGSLATKFEDIFVKTIHVGNGDVNNFIIFEQGKDASNPAIRFNKATNMFDYSTDGVTWVAFNSIYIHNHDDSYYTKTNTYNKTEVYTKEEVETFSDSRYVVDNNTGINIGNSVDGDKTIVFDTDDIIKPAIRFNNTTNKIEYRLAGNETWIDISVTGFDTTAHTAAHSNITTLNKITEAESLPLWNGLEWPKGLTVVNWSDIQNKPTSTVADIDDAVTKKHAHTSTIAEIETAIGKAHEHTNSTSLNKITEAEDLPLWNGGAWPFTGSGSGDMQESVYDTDGDGKVNSAVNADQVPWSGVQDKPSSVVADIDDAVTKKHEHTNSISLNKITEAENLPLWNGAAWPGGSGNGDMLKSTYDTTNNGKIDLAEVAEQVPWSGVQNKPSSVVADIDDAVTKKHEHTNKALLDSYTQTEANLASAIASIHSHTNKTQLDKWNEDVNGKPTYDGALLETFMAGTSSYLKDDGTVSIKGNILPDTANTRNLGSEAIPFNNIYTKEMHVSATSIYVNGKQVISDISNEMTFATTLNQAIKITAPGTGAITIDSDTGILNILSQNEVDIDADGGIEFNVSNAQAAKHINVSNRSAGGNITFTTLGVNSQVQFSSVDEIDLTAPSLDFNGNVDVSGTLVVGGKTFRPSSIDGTFTDNSDELVPTQKAAKTYVDTALANLSINQNVTFEVLNTNGDVGLNSDQLALGSHNHTGLTIDPGKITLATTKSINIKETDTSIITINGSVISLGATGNEINFNSDTLKYKGNDIYHAGNLNTSTLVLTTDSRLTDARTPVSHDNTAHSEQYLTATGVNYTLLNGNSLLGTGAEQAALGNHAHDDRYPVLTGDSTITGSLVIDGALTVNGTATLPSFTVGNSEKLNNKLPSVTSAADSVVISDATGKIDAAYIPDAIKSPTVNIKSGAVTFTSTVDVKAGNNISLVPNATDKNLTINTLVDEWKAETVYLKGELCVTGGKLYQALSNHTSSLSFGADMVDGYVKWTLLSINNAITNWSFDKNTIDQFLVSATSETPKVIHAPLTNVTDISKVQVEILQFITDQANGYEWKNIKMDVSNFTSEEYSEKYNSPTQMLCDGKMHIQTEFTTNTTNEGTLGTGNYFKCTINRAQYDKIFYLEMMEVA